MGYIAFIDGARDHLANGGLTILMLRSIYPAFCPDPDQNE